MRITVEPVATGVCQSEPTWASLLTRTRPFGHGRGACRIRLAAWIPEAALSREGCATELSTRMIAAPQICDFASSVAPTYDRARSAITIAGGLRSAGDGALDLYRWAARHRCGHAATRLGSSHQADPPWSDDGIVEALRIARILYAWQKPDHVFRRIADSRRVSGV
jgi:hypothetical protein